MRTDDFRPSDNVEDDREASASRGGMPGGAGGLGIGTIIVIGLISWYFGIDPSVLLNGAQILTGGGATSEQTGPAPPVAAGTPHDPTGQFVALVLGDTEDRWTEIFAANGRTYHPPKLRLFAGSEPTPCAFAQSAMGPFYCPQDQRIYLDTSFFDDLQHKFGGCSNSSACKFSEAYVIAHEVGHHVQNEFPCAFAQSAMGPFYCPRDRRIYLDTSFFDDLQHKFGGCSNSNACKFSEAYVIAHEVGHHVQNELGILPRVTQMQQASASRAEVEPPAGAHRAAGRLLRRCLGEPGAAEARLPRSRRRRSGAANRLRHRRRPAAEAGAGLCRAGRLHPWHFRAAQAVVFDRFQAGQGLGLRYHVGGRALV